MIGNTSLRSFSSSDLGQTRISRLEKYSFSSNLDEATLKTKLRSQTPLTYMTLEEVSRWVSNCWDSAVPLRRSARLPKSVQLGSLDVRSSKIFWVPSRGKMTLSAVHSLVVIHIGEPSRPNKWTLQLFGRKKSIILPDGCHLLDMRGFIQGVTIPSSRSGSRDDRLTKCSLLSSPVRMFIPCRADTGIYFRVGLVNLTSRAGVNWLLARRKSKTIILFSLGTERKQRCSWLTTSSRVILYVQTLVRSCC